MVARRRKIDRDEITYAIIFIVAIIATLLCLSYLWPHEIPVIYLVFLWIINIVWVTPFLTSFVIFISRLAKYLWQVPPLWRKHIIAGLGFLALFLVSIVVLISYIILIVSTLVSINIVPPLTKSFSIVNATLTMYKLSHCYKVCSGVPLNQTVLNPVGSNETGFVKTALPQSFVMLFTDVFVIIVILLGFWLPMIPLLKKLLEYSTGDKKKAYDTLCRDDRLLLYSYIAMTLITYLSVSFSVIVYSLAILSSSEFPYAYAMLITTFLVLIAEVLMIRNGGARSPWSWVALLISVASSLVYTVAAFYIGGFVLPSTCLTGVNDVLGIYESSLPLAGISGAIPYALTLSIIHHRIMCSRVESEETKLGA